MHFGAMIVGSSAAIGKVILFFPFLRFALEPLFSLSSLVIPLFPVQKSARRLVFVTVSVKL